MKERLKEKENKRRMKEKRVSYYNSHHQSVYNDVQLALLLLVYSIPFYFDAKSQITQTLQKILYHLYMLVYPLKTIKRTKMN